MTMSDTDHPDDDSTEGLRTLDANDGDHLGETVHPARHPTGGRPPLRAAVEARVGEE